MGSYRSMSFLVFLLLLTAPATARMPTVSEKLQQGEHEQQPRNNFDTGHSFNQLQRRDAGLQLPVSRTYDRHSGTGRASFFWVTTGVAAAATPVAVRAITGQRSNT